jgi:hypothetical protein
MGQWLGFVYYLKGVNMTTIFEAREALDKAAGIIKELIMADKLVTDVQRDYSEFLNFWEEVYNLDRY